MLLKDKLRFFRQTHFSIPAISSIELSKVELSRKTKGTKMLKIEPKQSMNNTCRIKIEFKNFFGMFIARNLRFVTRCFDIFI